MTTVCSCILIISQIYSNATVIFLNVFDYFSLFRRCHLDENEDNEIICCHCLGYENLH